MINLKDKTILITGGTGSFGKNFTEFLLKNTPVKKIIIFSRDELKQFKMEKEFNDGRLRFFIGDVRDLPRLERAFNGVDIVIHAAALKQVPILEFNPYEAVKTNILGSQNVIEAAINRGVKKVLLVSTDKAVQPINLYGSTKLCAEKLFVNGNFYSPDETFFSCVRYGNVIGSRGSIVESLLKNRNAEKVFITDKRMTRFWITLEQSFELVLFALENMAGGEIFVPRIPSMKLAELFKALVPGAKKEIIGIRAGEKIHEILLTEDEARHAYGIGDYFVILPENEEIFCNKIRFKKIIKISKSYRRVFVSPVIPIKNGSRRPIWRKLSIK
ncbi:MAG: UDP-N-acetylglucosamine 4,6-dehydratase (inverting) [Patescibacteria group bacterium]|nr:UDP-N-acetylglucosamine 4,6-dehydratase (inverting) [Patescibacteria group bacterium]